jgi:large subunit ribosomal protein L21
MKQSDVAYAIVRVGGQQFKVSAGDTFVVDRVDAEEGKSLTLEPLAVRTDSGEYDADVARSAKVKVTVAEHVLGEKIKIFTYKPKKTFKKARGHRSRLSKLTVESITLKEEKENKGGA